MTIRLYDTVTREVRDFVPLEEGKAGIYVCGLTVQSEPHVGPRPLGGELRRAAALADPRGYDVTFIRNVTDIDDKILVKAAEQGRPWYNLAYDDEPRARRGLRRAQRAAADLRAAAPPATSPRCSS